MAKRPAPVDLRPQLGPARDQGRRPTCLAFAVSAAHRQARGGEDLSVEALFKASKRRDGLAVGAGTSVSAITRALADDGQCVEADWPYGAVTATASSEFFRARVAEVAHSNIRQFAWKHLGLGRCVVLIVRLTEAWFSVGPDGVLAEPTPADRIVGSHAVLAVGFDRAGSKVMVRNSWGDTWGLTGHGWLGEGYVKAHARIAAVVRKLT